jgi:hypothetical protein
VPEEWSRSKSLTTKKFKKNWMTLKTVVEKI